MRAIAVIPLLIILGACSTARPNQIPPANQHSHVNQGLLPAEIERTRVNQQRLLEEGERPDWALAMSGGGLRSASFNIGVMKALFDLEILPRVEAISSVSGGGYASYWLYSKHLERQNEPFGASALHDDIFLRNLCELQSNANFFSELLGARALAAGWLFRDPSAAFNTYKGRLERVFGDTTGTRLDSLSTLIDQGRVPQFILNATLRGSVFDHPDRNRLRNSVELSPHFFGNPAIGYSPWGDGFNPPEWSWAVATSGASVSLLQQTFVHTITNDTLSLWDGGHSENLAALSLIRRGARNIIIVDAEHDPDYVFEGYERLKHLLPTLGMGIHVPEIEEFVGNRRGRREGEPFAAGIATGHAYHVVAGRDSVTSRIIYVKMSLPRELYESLRDDAQMGQSRDFWHAREAARRAVRATDRMGCSALEGPEWRFDPTAFPYPVYSYLHFSQERPSRWRRIFSRSPATRYEFPQTTTLDQSFYRDQLEAFVGLGYLQGLRVRQHVQSSD